MFSSLKSLERDHIISIQDLIEGDTKKPYQPHNPTRHQIAKDLSYQPQNPWNYESKEDKGNS